MKLTDIGKDMKTTPWDMNPDLKKQRITEVAEFICEVRGEVIDCHDEIMGDTRLSLGMRAYECCRTRLISEVEQGTWPWLSILNSEGRFTFLIGETPVRFIRTDPENLPSEKLIPSPEGSIQMSLFQDDFKYSEIRWFFVIDTFYKNVADNMYFVGYDPYGNIQCKWNIPLEEKSVMLSVLKINDEQPKPIAKAPVKIKPFPKKKDSGGQDEIDSK